MAIGRRGELAYGPATAGLVTLFGAKLDYERAKAIAAQLYAVLDQYLATRAFLAGKEATIADIAIYSYTAHAPEGGVSLEPYPNVREWLARVEALPGFIPMKRSPLPRAA